MNDILQLVTITQSVDEYGDLVATRTGREVFCSIRSIGQKEFYQAQAVGLQPEIKFVLADYLEYADEPEVVHGGATYRVLRTFRSGQELELVCYREVNPA